MSNIDQSGSLLILVAVPGQCNPYPTMLLSWATTFDIKLNMQGRDESLSSIGFGVVHHFLVWQLGIQNRNGPLAGFVRQSSMTHLERCEWHQCKIVSNIGLGRIPILKNWPTVSPFYFFSKTLHGMTNVNSKTFCEHNLQSCLFKCWVTERRILL